MRLRRSEVYFFPFISVSMLVLIVTRTPLIRLMIHDKSNARVYLKCHATRY
jgi:hypothetical protein